MTNPIYILLNGSPRSGKDTSCNFLKTIITSEFPGTNIVEEKFSAPIDLIVRSTLQMDDDTYQIYREQKKDESLPGYPNVSMRKLMIYVSENFCKILFGQDYYARQAYARTKNVNADFVLISDSGFQLEYDCFKELVESNSSGHVRLIKLFREGCTFENDSREYVNDPERQYEIFNNGTLDDLREELIKYVETFKM